jgi:hypothetical protein
MMNTSVTPLPTRTTRIGFHYYPDSLHYRESDLATWLPELKALGVSWLVLRSDTRRAIPEDFLSGLQRAGIEPVIQFQLSLVNAPDAGEVTTLLEAYAHWGARAVQLFDQPNASAAWANGHWAQQDLVERFLDRFLPLSNTALKLGLLPLFPILQPGGSYWDTAFLRAALVSMDRRKQTHLLQQLTLSAWAKTGSRSLNWGAGGPERWPESRPYATPADGEDQCGFRIYDWYQSVARSVLGRQVPVLLFGVGKPGSHLTSGEHRDGMLNIARVLAGEVASDPADPTAVLDPVPAEVLACNFWQLAGSEDAWYPHGGQPLPAVEAIKSWRAARAGGDPKTPGIPTTGAAHSHPIQHYLLLPTYDWGVSEWHLSIIRPFVQKYAPTIGFSTAEAALAQRVTVVGNEQSFSETVLDQLRAAGCSVQRVGGDGTSIATQMAER